VTSGLVDDEMGTKANFRAKLLVENETKIGFKSKHLIGVGRGKYSAAIMEVISKSQVFSTKKARFEIPVQELSNKQSCPYSLSAFVGWRDGGKMTEMRLVGKLDTRNP